jgi:hypothetical protein
VAERPYRRVVGQMIGVHRDTVIALDRSTIDQQVTTAEAAHLDERNRGGRVAGSRHATRISEWRSRHRQGAVAASPSTAGGQPNEAPDDQEGDVAALPPMTLFANSRDNDSADKNHTDKDRRYDGTNYSLLIHWPGS